jgi:hypothetical protein
VADEEDDYEVEYGKPPRKTRFEKGVSGNRKGRPTGSKNLATLFNEIASEFIPVTEGSKSRNVTRLEGVLRIQMNSALKGDLRAIKETLQMRRSFESQEQVEANAVKRDDVPTFNIQFIPKRPEGMVACRLSTGQPGYILRERVAEFLAAHPDAVVID